MNTSWVGGKNNFLGICYIVFGGLVLIATPILYYTHRKYGLRLVIKTK